MKMTTLDNYNLMPFSVQLICLCFDSMLGDFIIWIPPQRCPEWEQISNIHATWLLQALPKIILYSGLSTYFLGICGWVHFSKMIHSQGTDKDQTKTRVKTVVVTKWTSPYEPFLGVPSCLITNIFLTLELQKPLW